MWLLCMCWCVIICRGLEILFLYFVWSDFFWLWLLLGDLVWVSWFLSLFVCWKMMCLCRLLVICWLCLSGWGRWWFLWYFWICWWMSFCKFVVGWLFFVVCWCCGMLVYYCCWCWLWVGRGIILWWLLFVFCLGWYR